MTRDEVIRMAQESGLFAVPYPHPTNSKEVERFAALVAAAEREACAKVCEESMGAHRARVFNDELADRAAAIRARGDT